MGEKLKGLNDETEGLLTERLIVEMYRGRVCERHRRERRLKCIYVVYSIQTYDGEGFL